jgi:hypothetical protein
MIGMATGWYTRIMMRRPADRDSIHEERTMFNWLKTSLSKCVQRYQENRIEHLLQENRRLKAQLRELNDGQPIRLSPAEKRELAAKRQKLDPEVLQALDAIDLKEPE